VVKLHTVKTALGTTLTLNHSGLLLVQSYTPRYPFSNNGPLLIYLLALIADI